MIRSAVLQGPGDGTRAWAAVAAQTGRSVGLLGMCCAPFTALLKVQSINLGVSAYFPMRAKCPCHWWCNIQENTTAAAPFKVDYSAW